MERSNLVVERMPSDGAGRWCAGGAGERGTWRSRRGNLRESPAASMWAAAANTAIMTGVAQPQSQDLLLPS